MNIREAASPGAEFLTHQKMEMSVAQKGPGGNPGAITSKDGDGARGSLGTGRGGGSSDSGSKKTAKKKSPDQRENAGQKISSA
jgi:hypothetical protein